MFRSWRVTTLTFLDHLMSDFTSVCKLSHQYRSAIRRYVPSRLLWLFLLCSCLKITCRFSGSSTYSTHKYILTILSKKKIIPHCQLKSLLFKYIKLFNIHFRQSALGRKIGGSFSIIIRVAICKIKGWSFNRNW